MIPARSPGANPVRHATASSGEVSQDTLASSRARRAAAPPPRRQRVQDCGAAVEPAAGLLGGLGQAGLGDDDGDERLGAHRGPGQACCRSSLIARTSARASSRRCRVIHWSRSAPSSGTVRTRRRISSMSSVRAGRVEQVRQAGAVPGPSRRCRCIPMPGVDDRAGDRPGAGGVVLDDRDPPPRRPGGGPSWISTPARTRAGRLGQVLDLRHGRRGSGTSVHRPSPPAANATDATAQPVADRPRTGTTVTAVTTTRQQEHPGRRSTRLLEGPEHRHGRQATVATCHPVSPNGTSRSGPWSSRGRCRS